MLLITAPSKTQRPAPNTAPSTQPLFIDDASQLNRLLREFSKDQLCTLMKMSEKLGEATMQLIEEFRTPLAEDQCRQAIFTFEGDNYSALRPAEYTTAQLAHLQDHLLILSGMYGILRPLDLMPPYRLEMGAALQTEKGKNLYEFWGDRITETINALCREKAYRTVVNLASAEYSRSVRQKKLQPDFLTITFKEAKGDGYKSVPIHSKRARGMMIDYVAANLLTEPDQLRSFTTGGYCFNESISNDKEWVFTRA